MLSYEVFVLSVHGVVNAQLTLAGLNRGEIKIFRIIPTVTCRRIRQNSELGADSRPNSASQKIKNTRAEYRQSFGFNGKC